MSRLHKLFFKALLLSFLGSMALLSILSLETILALFFSVSTSISSGRAADKADPTDSPVNEATARIIKTEHFIFRYATADNGSAQFLARESEPAYQKLINYLGKDPRIRIMIYIAPDDATFHLLQPEWGEGPSWAAGLAYPGRNLILIKSPRLLPSSKTRLKETLLHELTHVMIEKIIGPDRGLPRWLNEGLAMYIAGEWGSQETISLTRISLLDSFVPFEKLDNAFPSDENDARQAYIQSFSFVAYLRNNYGIEGLHKLIWAFSKTRYTHMALQLALSTTLADLERNWRSYVRLRYTWIPTIISGTTIWFFVGWLFIAGYLAKKRQIRNKLKQWEEEEAQEM